jgi:hypothetical protein
LKSDVVTTKDVVAEGTVGTMLTEVDAVFATTMEVDTLVARAAVETTMTDVEAVVNGEVALVGGWVGSHHFHLA